MTGFTSGAITVSADGNYDGVNYPGWKCFDGVVGAYPNSWISTYAIAFPHWVKVDFGATQAIYTVKVASSATQAPKDFKIQYSDNNSTWSDAYSTTNVTSWVENTYKTFTLTTPAQARYWRLYATAGNVSTLLEIREIQFLS